MFKTSHFPVIAACLSLAFPQIAQASDKTAGSAPHSANAKGEAELTKILMGRTPGKPRDCLGPTQRSNMQIIDKTAFVFRDGDTIYVNRPSGANFLDGFDYPVFKLFGSDLCRMDQAEMLSRTSSIPGPVLTMGSFIPYKLTKDADHSATAG